MEGHVELVKPGASKFCFWASGNGSLVARWASETSLSSLVSDNSSQKQLKNVRLQDEQNNELKALINFACVLSSDLHTGRHIEHFAPLIGQVIF